jgi:hypothetical protein
VRNIRKDVNKRLFSIKDLFYLSFPVKLQFFKSFIMPVFDYCSTLFIYLTKSTIQKLVNCYYLSLALLLNFKIPIEPEFNFITVNNQLEKLGLQSLQHRVISRLVTFTHKLFYYDSVPLNLKNKLIFNNQLNKQHDLRNINSFSQPSLGNLNKYKERTFEYFFPKFINAICLDFCTNAKSFSLRFVKTSAFNNSNLHYLTIINFFKKFDLNYVLKEYYFWKYKNKREKQLKITH